MVICFPCLHWISYPLQEGVYLKAYIRRKVTPGRRHWVPGGIAQLLGKQKPFPQVASCLVYLPIATRSSNHHNFYRVGDGDILLKWVSNTWLLCWIICKSVSCDLFAAYDMYHKNSVQRLLTIQVLHMGSLLGSRVMCWCDESLHPRSLCANESTPLSQLGHLHDSMIMTRITVFL